MHQLRFMPKPVLDGKDVVLHTVLLYLHAHGRVARFADVYHYVHKINMWRHSSTDLHERLREVPNVFYCFEIYGKAFVSIARPLAYLNARIAKRLSVVTNINYELLLFNFQEMESKTSIKRATTVGNFHDEYALCKAAMCCKEILELVARMTERFGGILSMDAFAHESEDFTSMTKHVLFEFKGTSTIEDCLAEFLMYFPYTFDISGHRIRIDLDSLLALIRSYEMDLLWSYACLCAFKEVTSIALLTDNINTFIDQINLRLPQLSQKFVEDRILKCRVENFFLPGDGTVWLRLPVCPLNLSDHIYVDHFYKKYLSNKDTNQVHYTEIVSCLQRNVHPLIFQKLNLTDSLDMATCMYGPMSPFDFTNGYMHLTKGKTSVGNYLNLVPIECPFNFINEPLKSSETFIDKFYGVVLEISLLSALVRVRTCYGESRRGLVRSFSGSAAFCHVSTTTLAGGPVDNLYEVLDLDDPIEFYAQFETDVNMNRPYHLVVTDITKFPKMRSLITYNYHKFRTKDYIDSMVPVKGLDKHELERANYSYLTAVPKTTSLLGRRRAWQRRRRRPRGLKELKVEIKTDCSRCSKMHLENSRRCPAVEPVEKIYSNSFAKEKKKLLQISRIQHYTFQTVALDVLTDAILVASSQAKYMDNIDLTREEIMSISKDIIKMAAKVFNIELEKPDDIRRRKIYLTLVESSIHKSTTTFGVLCSHGKIYHLYFVDDLEGLFELSRD